MSGIHGPKSLVGALLNALKHHFLDNDEEIVYLVLDMAKSCSFVAPDGHKCALDAGKITRALVFGNTGKSVPAEGLSTEPATDLDVHGIKDLVGALLNALKQHFLDNDAEILDLAFDMAKS